MKKPDPNQYDLEEAIRRQIESESAVLFSEDALWRDKYNAIADKFFYELPPKATFIGEDIRRLVSEQIGEPHHPNVWGAAFGAVIRALIKNGYVAAVGERRMSKVSSHGRGSRLYEKL